MIDGLLDSLKGLKPADLRKSDTKINSSLETDLNRLMTRIDDLDEQPPTELIDQQAYLTEAAKAKLKITNSKLYDIFLLTAKANGHNPKSSRVKRKEALPKASFNQFSAFLSGGM